MTTPYSKTYKSALRRFALLLLMVVGVQGAWAKEGDVTVNADIDFSNAITGAEPYTIEGTVGKMTWTQQWTYAPTIVDGILCFGNFDGGVVELQNNSIASKDIVTISFEMAFARLSGKYVGFQFKDTGGNEILTQQFDAYNTDFNDLNPLNLDWSKMYNGSNTVIQERCVYFTIKLDYAQSTITTQTRCYMSGAGKAVTEGEFSAPLPSSKAIGSFVLLGNINNAERYSTLDNLKITTIEGDNTALRANYTVNWVCNGDVLKTETREGDVGAPITVSSFDKANFEEDGVRYIYESDDASTKTIGEDGATVVTVRFREAAKYNYTVKTSYNGIDLPYTVTGSVWEDLNTISVPYPRFQSTGTTLVERAPDGDKLTKSVTVTSDGFIETFLYTATGITNLYLLSEAENLGTGLPTNATTFTDRVSNGLIIHGASGTLLSLPAGNYIFTLGAIGGDNSTHQVLYRVNAGETQIIEGTCTENRLTLFTSDAFTLSEPTDITFTCSDPASGRGIDLIYVQKTSATYTVHFKNEDGDKIKDDVVLSGVPGADIASEAGFTALLTGWTDKANKVRYAFSSHDAGIIAIDNSTEVTITMAATDIAFNFPAEAAVAYIEDLAYTIPIDNTTDETPTFTISGTDAGTYVTPLDNPTGGVLTLIRTTGSDPLDTAEGDALTVTAHIEGYSDITCQLRVKTRNKLDPQSWVSGKEFTVPTGQQGLLASHDVALEGLDMTIGKATDTQVLRAIQDASALTGIDAWGNKWGCVYDEPRTEGDAGPDKGYGTYYVFRPTVSRTLIVKGYFADEVVGTPAGATLYEWNGTAQVSVGTIAYQTGEATGQFDLQTGKTYVLYAPWPSSFNLSYATYVRKPSDTVTIDFTSKGESNDLLMFGGQNDLDGKLNRQIPCFDITFGGTGQATYKNGNNAILLTMSSYTSDSENDGGRFTITPRIKPGGVASNVKLTAVKLYMQNPDTRPQLNGLTWKNFTPSDMDGDGTAVKEGDYIVYTFEPNTTSHQIWLTSNGKNTTNASNINAVKLYINKIDVTYEILDDETELDNDLRPVTLSFNNAEYNNVASLTQELHVVNEQLSLTSESGDKALKAPIVLTQTVGAFEKTFGDFTLNASYESSRSLDVTVPVDGGTTTFTASFAGNQYFLPASASFRINSLTDADADLIVGESQVWFRNNEFAAQIGDNGDGDWTYTSSNTSVLDFRNTYAENGPKIGIATITGAGFVTVTATKGAESHSYLVKVKKDSWDFSTVTTDKSRTFSEYGAWNDDVPESRQLQFLGTWWTGTRAAKAIKTSTGHEYVKVPAIAGQNVILRLGKGASGGSYNHNLEEYGLEDKGPSGNLNSGHFRLAGDDAYEGINFTAKVMEDYNYFIVGVNDATNGQNDYVYTISTTFPVNPISFGLADYTVNYYPGTEQTGQKATTLNSSNAVLYVSMNTGVATVHPLTGRVTVQEGQSGQTATIRAYNLGDVGRANGSQAAYAEYTLRVSPAQDLTTEIVIEDLLYKDAYTATGRGLDRTIPYFSVSVTGDAAAVSRGTTGLALKYASGQRGQLTIRPRYTSAEEAKIAAGTSKGVTFSRVRITFDEAPTLGEKIVINGETQTLTADLVQTFNIASANQGPEVTISYGSYDQGFVLAKVKVEGQTASAESYTLVEGGKKAPELGFIKTAYDFALGSELQVMDASVLAPFRNFRGVRYTLTDNTEGAFSLSNNYISVSETQTGTAKLNATFNGTDLFAAGTAVSTTLSAVENPYRATLDISNKIAVSPTPSIDGFAFNSIKLEPLVVITDSENSEYSESSGYTVSYTTSDNALAYVDETGNLYTRRDVEGLVTITATVTPTPTSTLSSILTASFDLMVLSGYWDFRNFTYNVFNTQLVDGGDSPTGDNWSQNNNARLRDTKFMEPITITRRDAPDKALQRYGDPLPFTMALESQYKMRFQYSNSAPNYGNLHLFGKGRDAMASKYGHGGVLKIPVRKGMVLEINGWTDGSSDSEMLINITGSKSDDADEGDYAGISDLQGNPVVKYLVDEDAASKYFIVTTDAGFLYIINPSTSLDFHINYILLSQSIQFRDGLETYVEKQDGKYTYTNPIINGSPYDTFSYIDDVLTGGVVTAFNTETGTATLRANYDGSYRVYASGTSTDPQAYLSGSSNSYLVHIISLAVDNSMTEVSMSELTFGSDVLKGLITTGTKWNAADNINLETIRNAAVFSVKEDETDVTAAVLSGKAPNQTLAVAGIGTVKLIVKVGTIEKTIEITIKGADFVERCPSIPKAEKSYVFKLKGKPENVTINEDEVRKNILGDLAADKDKIHVAYAYVDNEHTITVSRTDGEAFGKGGAIPITVTYAYDANEDGDVLDEGETGHTMTAVLTVAYTGHTWSFDAHNLLTFNYAASCGSGESEYDGLKGFYTNGSTKKRTGLWESSATFDEPVDATTNHSNAHEWRFTRKQKGKRGMAIVYNYNHSVRGENATIIPETTGLQIRSDKGGDPNDSQMGVEMISEPSGEARVPVLDGGNYDMRNLMLRQGGTLIIPKVQPGQWIEMRWYRHIEDWGERLKMKNLCDINGTLITEIYKIQFTDGTTTYMLQVDPNLKEDDEGVYRCPEDGNLYVDALFEVADQVALNVLGVILREPGWKYDSSLTGTSIGGTVSGRSGDKIPLVGIYENGGTMTFSKREAQHAPQAQNEWEITWDGPLEGVSIGGTHAINNDDPSKPRPENALADGTPTFTWTGGWGKVYVTMNGYTSDYEYVVNRRTWIITIGKQPQQTYPYTWDFTKYYADTKSLIGSSADEFYKEDPNYDAVENPYGAHEFRHEVDTWTERGNLIKAVTTGYNTSKYTSYFVDGGQLVSYALKDDPEAKGRVPETEGLGFRIANKATGGLTLNMASRVGNSGQTARTDASGNYASWGDGKLSLVGGGTVIVPAPGEAYKDYYIYVSSSVPPSSWSASVKRMVGSTTDAETVEYDNHFDVKEAAGQYKFHFQKNEDAELTFKDGADIYAIGVTNQFKQLKPLNGTGWATESRRRNIDYTLDSLLTVNPVQPYAVIEREGTNPYYDTGNARTFVAVSDRRAVVPAKNGVVLKQYTDVPAATYRVPLFVPAVTTAADLAEDYDGNLMMANLEDRLLTGERETGVLDDNEDGVDDSADDDGTYTRFILSSRYMTWRKADGMPLEKPTAFEEKVVPAAVFYRLHIYTMADAAVTTQEECDALNTLAANKAYLLLPTDKVPKALWNESDGLARRRFVGIVGESDQLADDILQSEPAATDEGPVRLYNLSGQEVDPNRPLPAGVYIRNGQKVLLKP